MKNNKRNLGLTSASLFLHFDVCVLFFFAFATASSSKDTTGKLDLGGNQVLRAGMFIFPNVETYFEDEELMSDDAKIGKRVEALLWYCHTRSDIDVKWSLVSKVGLFCWFVSSS